MSFLDKVKEIISDNDEDDLKSRHRGASIR